MASITDWNVIPNKLYFVKLSDNGSQVLVELFNTQAYAQAGSNRVAYGNCAYGISQEVDLTDDSTYPAIDYFNNSKSYHLKVTFSGSESAAIFKAGPFYDKEINDILCCTADMQAARAAAEINKGTHSVDTKSLTLSSHDTDIRDGLVVTVNTDAFVNQNHMIKKAVIQGFGEGLIVDQLELYKYEDLSLY